MYKRRELQLHSDGIHSLALAVMRQWNVDGRPIGDAQGVSLWAELLIAHQQRQIGGVHNGSIANTLTVKKK